MSDSEPKLGITTEFVSTGEVFAWDTATKFYLQKLARELLPDMRVGFCLRHRQSKTGNVNVNWSEERKKAWLSGLFRCGSSWVCAFCATHITEQRRQELSQALAENMREYTPILITYTVAHHAGQSLNDLLSGMLEAFRAMKAGRSWYLLKDESGLIGSVRSLEITYGANGWHPHLHELALYRTSGVLEWAERPTEHVPTSEKHRQESAHWNACVNALAEWLETQIARHYWLPALKRMNMSASLEHGVKTTHSHDAIIEYIAKWGYAPVNAAAKGGKWSVESELTRGVFKQGRMHDSVSPFELLWLYGQGDREAGMRFVEYAAATFGRSQLQWTPGLKKLLRVQEIADEQLAHLEPEIFDVLAEIEIETWRKILRHDLRGELLTIAGTGDAANVHAFLDRVIMLD